MKRVRIRHRTLRNTPLGGRTQYTIDSNGELFERGTGKSPTAEDAQRLLKMNCMERIGKTPTPADPDGEIPPWYQPGRRAAYAKALLDKAKAAEQQAREAQAEAELAQQRAEAARAAADAATADLKARTQKLAELAEERRAEERAEAEVAMADEAARRAETLAFKAHCQEPIDYALHRFIEPRPVESTNIATMGYDPETYVLEVRFRHNGRVYRYARVSRRQAEALFKATRPGVGFAKIRQTCPYREIKDGDLQLRPEPVQPDNGTLYAAPAQAKALEEIGVASASAEAPESPEAPEGSEDDPTVIGDAPEASEGGANVIAERIDGLIPATAELPANEDREPVTMDGLNELLQNLHHVRVKRVAKVADPDFKGDLAAAKATILKGMRQTPATETMLRAAIQGERTAAGED